MSVTIDEFCALIKIVTDRYGDDVMISVQDKEGRMYLHKKGDETRLGYIDINTGSLVWFQGEA